MKTCIAKLFLPMRGRDEARLAEPMKVVLNLGEGHFAEPLSEIADEVPGDKGPRPILFV